MVVVVVVVMQQLVLYVIADAGVVAVQTGHQLKPLDTGSLIMACEHCMVTDCALRDVWVSC